MRAIIRRALKILLILIIMAASYAIVINIALKYFGNQRTEILVPIIGACIAFITSIYALLKDFIIAYVNAPKLVIEIYPHDKRDCHKTYYRNQAGQFVAWVYYFRIRIRNIGWDTAENVEVSLEEVKKRVGKNYIIDYDFIPLNLKWSLWGERRTELPIPSDTYRHCDLAHLEEPKHKGATENGLLLFKFDVLFYPNVSRTSLLPGDYKVKISATGKNARIARKTIMIKWNGAWHDDIDSLYKNGLFIKCRHLTTGWS